MYATKAVLINPEAAIAIYTCPMHSQIQHAGPGTCPICGMALEPIVVSAELSPNHELADMTLRFWIGLVLTLPVFMLARGAHISAIMNPARNNATSPTQKEPPMLRNFFEFGERELWRCRSCR